MKASFSFRKNPHLFEINTLVWLNDLGRRLGRPVTLGSVPENVWDALAAQGWDFIWLMGVWERSPASATWMLGDEATRKSFDEACGGGATWKPEEVLGSPYAVRQYEPDAHIGTWEELDKARGALNRRGIGLMLDFVGNHTALDHPWTREHSEYYIQGCEEDLQREPGNYFSVEKATGARAILARGRDPYFLPWPDVAQLDFFSEAMRGALLAELAEIAEHSDGLRCDMAMLALNDVFARTWANALAGRKAPAEEFWTQAMRAAPGMVWLAEAYWGLESRLLEMGFQFAYDKALYDMLRDGRAPEIAVRVRAPEETVGGMAHFLENHDEARAATVFGMERLPAAATLIATLPGMRFYHSGQLEGRKVHWPIGLSVEAPEADDANNTVIRELYQKLLGMARAPAFCEGMWRALEVTSAWDGSFVNLCAYEWRMGEATESNDEWRVVVANPSAVAAQGRVHFGGEIEAGKSYVFNDELNGPQYLREGDEIVSQGLYVRLEAWQAHVFRVEEGVQR